MSEWINTNLYEIIDIIGGGTPKTSVKEYWNGVIPWLSVVDFNNGNKYVKSTEKTITELGLNNSSTKMLLPKDIIISARGTVGALAMLKVPMAFNQSCYGIRSKEGKASCDYVYYLIKDSIMNFLQISHGGVFDTITKDTFKEIQIQLPPLPEQKAIAEVLSSLDDKIDLLHRQNQTLEQMAETLFRQWFIEEAKEEWEEFALEEIATIQNGYAFNSNDYVEMDNDVFEVVKMGHIEKGGGLRSNPKRDYVPRESHLYKWVLNKGDIIMAMTDMKDNVVILGVPAMIDKDDHYVLNQRVARIFLKNNDVLLSKYFLYIQLKDPQFIATLQSKANSGVQVNLSTSAIRESTILIPPLKIQQKLVKTIDDLYLRKESNDNQLKTLEKMRDTLLPKLMSGEVRVKMN